MEMVEVQEQRKRGRPKLSDEEARRAPVSFRTTPAMSDKIKDAAEAAGRSIAQEVEYRLELSFAREEDAGSASAVTLGDLVRLVTARLEGQTGKSWTNDYDTWLAVKMALNEIVEMNAPAEAEEYRGAADRAEDASAKADELRLEVERSIPEGLNALAPKQPDPEKALAYMKQLKVAVDTNEKVIEHLDDRIARLERVGPKVEATLEPLVSIFRLKH